jgi:hypothetical protein
MEGFEMKKAIFAMFAGAALAACGGGGGGSLSAGEAIEESWSIQCAKIFECRDTFPGEDADFEAAFGTSEADCVDIVAGETEFGPDEVEASIEAGNMTFNADDAEVCLDSFGDIACDDLWTGNVDSPPECDTAFEGQVEDGGECTLDEECAESTSFCDGPRFGLIPRLSPRVKGNPAKIPECRPGFIR